MPGGLIEFTAFSPSEAATRYLAGLPDGATVAVALSGGGDSVGLLSALYEAACARNGRVRLAALTVDHGLRSGSADEAAAMAELCHGLSIPHLVLSWQGDKPKTGLSEAAREARYRLLAEGVARLHADCLVTAHTLDDQLETVEMRRRRSDRSPRGLAGIAPAALFFGWLPVHRPFLRVLRADIRNHLSERRIGWFDDPSNDDPRYERVRVRQAKEFALGPDAIAAAAERRGALATAAAAYLEAHARMPLPLLFELDARQEDEAANLALATLIAVAGGQPHLPGQEQLERLRSALKSPGAVVSLGRTVVERRKDKLYIGRDQRNLPVLEIAPGESIAWDGRFRIANETQAVITIAPSVHQEPPEGVPSRIARRALATLPICAEPGRARDDVTVLPLLAPFETVLLSFDGALADALCRLSGRPLFPCFLGRGVETQSICG